MRLSGTQEHLFPTCGLASSVPHLGSGQLGENLLALASCPNGSSRGETTPHSTVKNVQGCWFYLACNLRQLVSQLAGRIWLPPRSSTRYSGTAIGRDTGVSPSVCVQPAPYLPNVCCARGRALRRHPGTSSGVQFVYQTAMERKQDLCLLLMLRSGEIELCSDT